MVQMSCIWVNSSVHRVSITDYFVNGRADDHSPLFAKLLLLLVKTCHVHQLNATVIHIKYSKDIG